MPSNESSNELQEYFPKVLYKFRYFDKDNRHLRILTHNEIFFTSPGRLNDPFDCRIPVRYDLGNKAQVIIRLQDILKRENSSIKNKEARKEAKRLYKTKKHKDRDYMKLISDNIITSKTGVFCLSANYSNILNWAHYSDSHKGFCIGFDSRILEEVSAQAIERNNKLLILAKVNYSKDYPIINPYRIEHSEIAEIQLLTKSKDWEYEEEFRMILLGSANKLLQLPDNAIRRVILGCDMQNDNQEKIIDIVRKRKNKVSVFKAKPSQDAFKLEFERIRIS